MADRIPVKARYAPGSPTDVVALQEFEPTDTISLNLISGFSAGVTTELANNSIGTLGDVDTSGSPSPANGEVLAWNSISGMWEPTVSPGSSFAIWGNITGTLSDQIDLQQALDNKSNVGHLHTESDITDLQAYLLNITAEPIGDLSNVTVPAPLDGQVLTFNNTTGDWEATTPDAVITDHTLLTNIGTNTHTQIDTHIGDGTIHFTEATIDHLNILNVGTNSHIIIDSHIADTTLHFTEASVDHLNILNTGTNTHAELDTHVGDGTIHYQQSSIVITESQISDLQAYLLNITAEPIGDLSNVTVPAPIDGQVLTFNNTTGVWEASTPTPGVTDHTLLTNIGTNSHVIIDSHIADTTLHFTEASIDHLNILNVGTNTHAVIDTHIADMNIHYTDAPADTQDYVRNNNSWVVATSATFGEYKGPFDASAGVFPTTLNQGDWFNVTVAGTVDGQSFIVGDILIALIDSPSTTTFAGNWTVVPNVSVTDHTMLTNIGTNTHQQIDTHIADGTIHFTEASIDHVNILNVGTNTHAQIDTHIVDTSVHFSVLDGLSDVNVPTPIDGQALVWNNTSSLWEASTVSGADELVKVSATDTVAGYLSTELVAGSNIVLTVLNHGVDEKLEIKYSRTGMPYIATIGGNDMVVYDDTTRASKTLSSETQILYFAESSVGDNDWMQVQHATDADSGYVMPFNGTIVSIAMHCENTTGVTKDMNLYFNATNNGSIGQFVGAGEQQFSDTSLNLDFVAGDKIRLRGAPGQGTIRDTNIQIRIKWRV